MRIIGVLLAAGAGVRFGGGKLLAKLDDGSTVGIRACNNLIGAVPDVIAVVRPGDDDLARELSAAGARVVICDNAGAGMGASLSYAVRAAADAGAGGAVVALGDMPWIEAATFAAVAAAVARGEQLVVPRYRGRRGHPVGFGSGYFESLTQLRDDQGARDVIAQASCVAWIDVDDPGILRDIDVPADLGAAT